MCALVKRDFTVVPIVFADKYLPLEIIGFDIVNVTPILRFFVIYRPPCCNDQAATYGGR